MGKRATQTAAKTATKKPKVDPALALVIDTVKKANHLPEQCSAMLASMLPFSLAVASDERAECQQSVVTMAEETLGTLKTEMQAAVAVEEAKLVGAKEAMNELLSKVTEAESSLAEKKDALQTASDKLTEATTTETASKEVLSEKQAAHTTSKDKLASLEESKTALETAFQEHFKVPMEAGEGPHYKDLEQFLQTMDIEKSLHSTLPGTCAKSKEDRGSFDHVILEQLEKAMLAKISSLAESISSESSALAEHESAVKDTEADHTSKKESQDNAAAAVDSAKQELESAENTLSKAKEAVNEYQSSQDEATQLCATTKSKLEEFENGPLKNFVAFQTRTVCAVAAGA